MGKSPEKLVCKLQRPVLGVCSLRHLGTSWPVPLPGPAHSRPLPALSLVQIPMLASYWSRVSGSCCTLGEKSSRGDNHHDHHRRHHASLYPGRPLSPGGGVIVISDSVGSIIIILGTSRWKVITKNNHHYLDHHQPSSISPTRTFATQLRINIVSVLIISVPIVT